MSLNYDVSLVKSFLRDKYRMYRDAAKNAANDAKIYENFINSDVYKNAGVIFTYYSILSEVDTHNIIRRALKDNKKIALPKCINKDGSMEFYYIKETVVSLVKGMYSLKEPDDSICIKAEPEQGDLCLVPGLAFDMNGTRLGLGGGYYDRFLSNFKGKIIGLCYEECLVHEELPFEKHDIKVETIITNKKIYEIK